MKTLDTICIEQGTDKATRHPNPGQAHSYTPLYDDVFTPIRDKPIKFLEIGVGGAESIKSWLEYFPNAKIFGVDIVNSTNPWNTVDAKTHERYTFVTGNQSSDVFWKCFVANYGTDWDVILDDGGHVNAEIITTFNCLWPHIKTGGLYCVEDVGVCYSYGSVHVSHEFPTHARWVSDLIDDMHQGRGDIDRFHLSRELVIMRKR